MTTFFDYDSSFFDATLYETDRKSSFRRGMKNFVNKLSGKSRFEKSPIVSVECCPCQTSPNVVSSEPEPVLIPTSPAVVQTKSQVLDNAAPIPKEIEEVPTILHPTITQNSSPVVFTLALDTALPAIQCPLKIEFTNLVADLFEKDEEDCISSVCPPLTPSRFNAISRLLPSHNRNAIINFPSMNQNAAFGSSCPNAINTSQCSSEDEQDDSHYRCVFEETHPFSIRVQASKSNSESLPDSLISILRDFACKLGCT